MDKYSNETLYAILVRIEKHVKEQNGKVFTNTAFRLRAMGGFAVIGFLGISSLIAVIILWIKVFNQ